MKQNFWAICVAAVITVVCSCVEKKSAQELLDTYWDGHDFTSLDSFEDIKAAEDKFDGYIALLSEVSYEDAVKDMNHFLDSAAQNVVGYMVWSSWFEPFLHAKESPYRNDELFVAWLDKVLADNVIDDGSRMEHLAMMRKCMGVNRSGMPLQDVQVFAEDGSQKMLSSFSGKRTLLLFVDADCPSCLEGLKENVEEYKGKDTQLLAVLANGSSYHLNNIRKQLPEDVTGKWRFVYKSAHGLEEEGLYDISILPFRVLVTPDWVIEKSYF